MIQRLHTLRQTTTQNKNNAVNIMLGKGKEENTICHCNIGINITFEILSSTEERETRPHLKAAANLMIG